MKQISVCRVDDEHNKKLRHHCSADSDALKKFLLAVRSINGAPFNINGKQYKTIRMSKEHALAQLRQPIGALV